MSHDKMCEAMLMPPDVNRAGLCHCRLREVVAELAAAKAHNIRLIEAINRLHEVAQGMWSGSESEIADIVNSALENAT